MCVRECVLQSVREVLASVLVVCKGMCLVVYLLAHVGEHHIFYGNAQSLHHLYNKREKV